MLSLLANYIREFITGGAIEYYFFVEFYKTYAKRQKSYTNILIACSKLSFMFQYWFWKKEESKIGKFVTCSMSLAFWKKIHFTGYSYWKLQGARKKESLLHYHISRSTERRSQMVKKFSGQLQNYEACWSLQSSKNIWHKTWDGQACRWSPMRQIFSWRWKRYVDSIKNYKELIDNLVCGKNIDDGNDVSVNEYADGNTKKKMMLALFFD